jgi:hypothetical protein
VGKRYWVEKAETLNELSINSEPEFSGYFQRYTQKK